MNPFRNPFPFGKPKLVTERKFAGPGIAAPRVRAVLEAHCLPDGEYPQNRIRSIYFDTPELSAWEEKDNGDALKRKIRLRWYDDDRDYGGMTTVYLEAKFRICAARDKSRVEARVPSAWIRGVTLDDPSLGDFLAARAEELGIPLLDWSAVCCIGYDRLRFFDPAGSSRVCLDTGIFADRANPARFAQTAPIRLDFAVCEFKNPGGIPPVWAEDVAAAGLRLRSFSKYGEAMQRLSERKI